MNHLYGIARLSNIFLFQSALRMERQRAARLEAKLARQEMERLGTFSMTKRQIASNAKKVAAATPTDVNDLSKEELQDRYVAIHSFDTDEWLF